MARKSKGAAEGRIDGQNGARRRARTPVVRRRGLTVAGSIFRIAVGVAGVTMVTVIVFVALLYARLGAGPVEFPGAARLVEVAIADAISGTISNSDSDEVEVPALQISSFALALPEGSAGEIGLELRFASAVVHGPDGRALVSIDGIAVRPDFAGLTALLWAYARGPEAAGHESGEEGVEPIMGHLTAERVVIDKQIFGTEALDGATYTFNAIKADYVYAVPDGEEQGGLRVTAKGMLRGDSQSGGLTLEIDGRLSRAQGGQGVPIADIQVVSEGMRLDELIAHWPPGVSGNAREWIANNIADVSGKNARIDHIKAHLQLHAGSLLSEPVDHHEVSGEGTSNDADAGALSLDMEFMFSELEAEYINGMSPLRGAAGRGRLTLDELHLQLDRGYVIPEDGKRVMLGGSSLVFPDLSENPPIAEVALTSKGDLGAVLSLIDQEPLALVRKLGQSRKPGLASESGINMGELRGVAQVGARLVFPLLRALPLADIDVEVNAELSDLRSSFDLAGSVVDGDFHIRAERLMISATAQEMIVSGEVSVLGSGVDGEPNTDGDSADIPLEFEWIERYGDGAGHREVRAKGRVAQVALARLGVEIPGFDSGSALTNFTLRRQGRPRVGFQLSADLDGAGLSLPWLGWRKAEEDEGTLTLKGRIGDETAFSVDLKAGELEAEGRVSLDQYGTLRSAALDRVHLLDSADLVVDLTRNMNAPESGPGSGVGGSPGGAVRNGTGHERELEAELRGRYLDLEPMLDFSGGGDDWEKTDNEPLTVRFQIGEVRLSDTHSLRGVEGQLRRTSQTLSVDASGQMGQSALTLEYDIVHSGNAEAGPGHLIVQSQQAGELVEHLGLYEGAKGGLLTLTANTRTGENADDNGKEEGGLSGLIEMRGVRLTRGEGLQTILTTGRFAREQVAEVEDGLVFESIRIPFAYSEEAITLGQSYAKSPGLAISARGEVAPESDRIELTGVISPIYALTSPVENIPLLGQILTGDEGEGLLGMTFRMTGSLDDPQVVVNPLSLLTPGILRAIFPSPYWPDTLLRLTGP